MKRILILEDDFRLAMSWQVALEAVGFDVVLTADVSEAIQIADTGVDLVIADIVIRGDDYKPKKEGGLTLLSHLRLHVAVQPIVIAVSGTGREVQALEIAKGLRARETLEKPFTAQRVVELCQSYLNGS